MSRTLWRASLRYTLRHPWQFGLSLLGIALGVAVVVSIDLSIGSARRAFVLSNQAVLGKTTHRLEAGPEGLDERLYVRLRMEIPSLPAAPAVESRVGVADGGSFRLLGIDPFAEAPFRGHMEGIGGIRGEYLEPLLTRPGAVLMSVTGATRLGLAVGDALQVSHNGRGLELLLVGLLESDDALARESLGDLLLADISTAQESLQRLGRLDRIDLVVAGGEEGEGQLRRVRELIPAGVRVIRAGSGSRVAEQMTRAFNLNLVMLSLLALVVGMFLVYNTVTFSVVQRRELIGSLRAAGVTRDQIFVLILCEASLVAVAAALVGVALGVVLAEQLLGLVSRTINDLYFAVSVRHVSIAPGALAKGLLVGLGAALLAAAMPAWEATRVAPRAALSRSLIESRARSRVPRMGVAGALLLLVAVALLWIPGDGLALAFVALFAMVAGFALLAPGASLVLLGLAQPVIARLSGWVGRLAARGIAANLSRTAMAIAALMVALSSTVGVGVMVDSFRRSVSQWLEVTLRADFYVGLVGATGERALDPALLRRVGAVSGIAHMSTGRGIVVDADTGSVELVVLEMAPESYRGFELLEDLGARTWPAFDEGGAVLASEPYARRHGRGPGSTVRIFTHGGPREFPVTAVFRDYGSEHGTLIMSRATYERHWRDPAISTLGIYAAQGVDTDELLNALRTAVRGDQQVVVRANRVIKEASLEVFDRTFTVTAVLRLLATIVAFVGVLSALMALALERAKEIAVLRAQGLTPAQVWQLVQTQTGLMGLVAGLLSLPVGLAMALVLILVVNRRSFGWSMEVYVDPVILLQAVGLAVLAALIAGIYPAYRMARISPAAALRED
jgi:putative ABC transport system permease protein